MQGATGCRYELGCTWRASLCVRELAHVCSSEPRWDVVILQDCIMGFWVGLGVGGLFINQGVWSFRGKEDGTMWGTPPLTCSLARSTLMECPSSLCDRDVIKNRFIFFSVSLLLG